MFHRGLRQLLPLIAIYTALSLFWMGFANGVAPNIILAAYNERTLPILNWIFEGHRSLPVEHYLASWSAITGAVQIATILHLAIVILIINMDRQHRNPPSPLKVKSYSNLILILFSAA